MTTFLDLLDADANRAEEKYRSLRVRLKSFFQQNSIWDADLATDETIERVLVRISEGADLHAGVPAYCYGVAKFILLERRRRRPTEEFVEVAAVATGSSAIGLEPTEQRVLLKELLNGIPDQDDRRLFCRYHAEDRKKLAEELGVTELALRIKVHRIKGQIEPNLNGQAKRRFLETLSRKQTC